MGYKRTPEMDAIARKIQQDMGDQAMQPFSYITFEGKYLLDTRLSAHAKILMIINSGTTILQEDIDFDYLSKLLGKDIDGEYLDRLGVKYVLDELIELGYLKGDKNNG